MYNKNNPFLKYLGDKVCQILQDIESLRELITLVEGEFEYTNINTEEKLDILHGMLKDRQFDFEEVKELIEKMRNERKIEKKWAIKKK